MKKWYELNIKERYENVYKKHSIKDFMSWWSDDSECYMEIRFESWELAKECANGFKLPYDKRSIFVKHAWQLENVLKNYRGKSTLWFGINPRRPMRNDYGNVGLGCTDVYVSKSKFLFVDIDRIMSNKDGPATKEDLMNADFLAEQVMEELGRAGFNKNYLKICSGNGVQLLIKLDIPIELPIPEIKNIAGKVRYIEDSLFIQAKQIIQKGIGKILPSFSTKFKEEYKVEIDRTGFNVGRVGALPYSFNRKYDNPIIRGIVEIHNDGVNEGMSDYLKTLYDDSNVRKVVSKTFKEKTPLILSEEHKILSNNMSKNVIIDLMLNYTFPQGGINNTLWYGIKILLHNSGITINDDEYTKIHQMLMSIHNRSFSENGLEVQFQNNYNGSFNEGDVNIVPLMINKYLRLNIIKCNTSGKEGFHPPIFPVSILGKQKYEVGVNISPLLIKKNSDVEYKISELKEDPLKDISQLVSILYKIRRGDNLDDSLKEGDFKYTAVGSMFVLKDLDDMIVAFMKKYIKKWGTTISVYMMKNYMDDYLNYKRW